MNYFKRSLITLAVSSLITSAAFAGNDKHSNVKNMEDDSWATLTGQVTQVDDESFTLNYGSGNIEVDLDDGDFHRDVHDMSVGDEVTVIGKIDDDFFDETELDAASVLVGNQSQPYYSSDEDKQWLENRSNDIYWSSGDNEDRRVNQYSEDTIDRSSYSSVMENDDANAYSSSLDDVDMGYSDDDEDNMYPSSMDDTVTLVGQVESTSSWSDEVTLSVVDRELSVDISELSFDPLDEDSMQAISKGDTVRIKARIEDAMFDDYSVVATSMTKLKI